MQMERARGGWVLTRREHAAVICIFPNVYDTNPCMTAGERGNV